MPLQQNCLQRLRSCHFVKRQRNGACTVEILGSKQRKNVTNKGRKESRRMIQLLCMRFEGSKQREKGYHSRAFEWYTKAAELGDFEAHYRLGNMYHFGRFVEKDEVKSIHHMEQALLEDIHKLASFE
eukprot:scaffold26592_cov171-Skeletonema_menzelii.AAC.4